MVGIKSRYGLAIAVLLLLVLPNLGESKLGAGYNNKGEAFDNRRSGRVALVIGNNTYKALPDLNNAVRDAQDVAARLQALGFEVILRPNLERRAFFRDLQAFEAKLSTADVGLIFFAGHGIHADGVNWLVPSDADLNDEADLRPETIDSTELRRILLGSGAKVGILILDACRDNPLQARYRSFARGIRVSTQPISQIAGQRSDEAILFSAAEGETAFDGHSGQNSVFTAALLDALDQPNLSLFELFQFTLRQVRNTTNGQQTPYLSASLSEPYVLNAHATDHTVQHSDSEQEIKFWDSVLADGSAKAFDAYLRSYPNGAFVPLAELKRIQKLGKTEAQSASVTSDLKATEMWGSGAGVEVNDVSLVQRTVSPKEAKQLDSAHWSRVRSSTQLADLRGYMDANPHGLFRQQALQRINEVKSELPQPGETFKDCETCPEMIVLPGAETSGDDAKAKKSIDLAMGVFEITRGEFRHFSEETGYDAGERCWTVEGKTALNRFDRNWLNAGFDQSDSDPVVCVNWQDVSAYVEWLSDKTGYRYRLPSGAEWRYAAKGGTDTAYSWGDEVEDNHANCDGCGSEWDGKGTAPVGSFTANAWGLHDMHGNVWEWVSSCRGSTSDNSDENCKERYLYGGSWYYPPDRATSTSRAPIRNSSRGNSGGFRVVREM